MPVRHSLHDTANEARHGDDKQCRFPSLAVSVRAGEERSGNGAGLHRRDEVSRQVGSSTCRLIIKPELSIKRVSPLMLCLDGEY